MYPNERLKRLFPNARSVSSASVSAGGAGRHVLPAEGDPSVGEYITVTLKVPAGHSIQRGKVAVATVLDHAEIGVLFLQNDRNAVLFPGVIIAVQKGFCFIDLEYLNVKALTAAKGFPESEYVAANPVEVVRSVKRRVGRRIDRVQVDDKTKPLIAADRAKEARFSPAGARWSRRPGFSGEAPGARVW